MKAIAVGLLLLLFTGRALAPTTQRTPLDQIEAAARAIAESITRR